MVLQHKLHAAVFQDVGRLEIPAELSARLRSATGELSSVHRGFVAKLFSSREYSHGTIQGEAAGGSITYMNNRLRMKPKNTICFHLNMLSHSNID